MKGGLPSRGSTSGLPVKYALKEGLSCLGDYSTKLTRISVSVNRLDSLVGLFAVGRQPSASADPFGMRRSAYGLVIKYSLRPTLLFAFGMFFTFKANKIKEK